MEEMAGPNGGRLSPQTTDVRRPRARESYQELNDPAPRLLIGQENDLVRVHVDDGEGLVQYDSLVRWKGVERSGQCDEANRAVNAAIRYVTDYAQHGEADRWSAPLATFATAKGDCEDYAIAKYVALRQAGFSPDELRLVLVRDRAVREDHAVLAARLEGRWQILDNRHSELIEDSDAASFTPLFAINHRGVQLFAAPYAKRGLLGIEIEAAPPAAGTGGSGKWTGQDVIKIGRAHV